MTAHENTDAKGEERHGGGDHDDGMQMKMYARFAAMILAAFAPFTALWYASSSDYRMAILFNALMFGLARDAEARAAERFESAYDRALAFKSLGR